MRIIALLAVVLCVWLGSFTVGAKRALACGEGGCNTVGDGIPGSVVTLGSCGVVSDCEENICQEYVTILDGQRRWRCKTCTDESILTTLLCVGPMGSPPSCNCTQVIYQLGTCPT